MKGEAQFSFKPRKGRGKERMSKGEGRESRREIKLSMQRENEKFFFVTIFISAAFTSLAFFLTFC